MTDRQNAKHLRSEVLRVDDDMTERGTKTEEGEQKTYLEEEWHTGRTEIRLSSAKMDRQKTPPPESNTLILYKSFRFFKFINNNYPVTSTELGTCYTVRSYVFQ